ncbi:MAG TPA: mandelate racemase/muconate lactonizing enzyme family protein [Thermomicrobiales bacterium]|jgi:L-alanine-DL-glutamate epimerase-like enolase superfamily enzyme
MKITGITTTTLHIPEIATAQDATMFRPASGQTALFVEIATDAGLVGLGLSEATGTRAVIEQSLTPLLLGRDPLHHERLWEEMFWAVRSYGRKGLALCALSAIDIALWDLKGKIFDVPLFRLLGEYTATVPVYGSGGWTHLSEADLVREQAAFVEQGIPRVKMKVAKDFGKAEAEDLRRVAAVRRALGDEVTIYLDANGGYGAKQAIVMARRFEQYNIAWYEEPVHADDIAGLAEVRHASPIPVATGEHEYTKFGFKELLTQGAADIVQPDVARVGGVTEWLKIAHLAAAFNLLVAPHAVSLVHLHLACCTPNLQVVEILGVQQEADRIWYTEIPEPTNGMWSPFPDRPGLGLTLDSHAVARYAI